MSRRLRGKIGNALVVHLRSQSEYVLRRRAAAVEKNHGRGRLGERCTQPADRLIAMRIIHHVLSFLFARVQFDRTAACAPLGIAAAQAREAA